MFFSQDWRERVKAENPDAGFGKTFRFFQISGESHKIPFLNWQVKLVNFSEPSGKN